MRLLRSILTALLFAVFGIGGSFISYVLLPFTATRHAGLRIVRKSWRGMVWLFTATRLIRVDAGGLADVRGCILAANHPSLIDVVLLTALLPDTYTVARHGLKDNLFISPIVRKVFLPDDETLLPLATSLLASGSNILVFPEGSRTPADGVLRPFHRGTAQLALRTGAPLRPIRIDVSRRILGKHQSILDMGTRPVVYTFHMGDPLEREPLPDSGVFRKAAVELTAALRESLSPATASH